MKQPQGWSQSSDLPHYNSPQNEGAYQE